MTIPDKPNSNRQKYVKANWYFSPFTPKVSIIFSEKNVPIIFPTCLNFSE
jgi:hypothetical protein